MCCPTNFITETMCVQIEFSLLYRVLQEIMRNTPVYVSLLFYCVLNIYLKHLNSLTFKQLVTYLIIYYLCITYIYINIYIMNWWAFMASLKPSRQCSCRLYHTEIYIVCQVRDNTKEFIIRPRKVMGFCMCKRFTFIISQPSATEGIHANPATMTA